MYLQHVTAAPDLRNTYEALLFKFYDDNIDDDELEQLQFVSQELQAMGESIC